MLLLGCPSMSCLRPWLPTNSGMCRSMAADLAVAWVDWCAVLRHTAAPQPQRVLPCQQDASVYCPWFAG